MVMKDLFSRDCIAVQQRQHETNVVFESCSSFDTRLSSTALIRLAFRPCKSVLTPRCLIGRDCRSCSAAIERQLNSSLQPAETIYEHHVMPHKTRQEKRLRLAAHVSTVESELHALSSASCHLGGGGARILKIIISTSQG
jgi:hypothetical protein